MLLVTGATGRVGGHVLEGLVAAGIPARAALQTPRRKFEEEVRFSFTDSATWQAAFTDVEAMFVMRPPQIGNVGRDMIPALEAARSGGVRRMVFLSLQGAEKNPVVPHHKLERWIAGSGLEWTFVRAGFFMQNLSTTHAAEIRDLNQIIVPAGSGKTSFVDVRDVAAVAVHALTTSRLINRAITPTGVEALTYGQAADIISREIGRMVAYRRPGPWAYWRHARSQSMPAGQAAVMLALYSACRFNLAAAVTDDVRQVLGREPITFTRFAHDERAAWLPAAMSHGGFLG
ncbi:NmrA family NAD(P)-binding protein [Streptomyces sp. NPDC055056]